MQTSEQGVLSKRIQKQSSHVRLTACFAAPCDVLDSSQADFVSDPTASTDEPCSDFLRIQAVIVA